MASLHKQNSSSSIHPLDTDTLRRNYPTHFVDRPPSALDAHPPATKRSVVSNSRYFSLHSKFKVNQSRRANSQIQKNNASFNEGNSPSKPRYPRNLKVFKKQLNSSSFVKRQYSGKKALKKQGSTATLRKKTTISPRAAWPNKRKLSNSNSKYIRKLQVKNYVSDGSSSASPPKPDAKLNSDLFFPDDGRTRHIEQVMMGPGVGLGSLLSSSLFDSQAKVEDGQDKNTKTTDHSFSPKRMSPGLKKSKLLRSSRKSISSFKKVKKEPDFVGAIGLTKKPSQALDTSSTIFQRKEPEKKKQTQKIIKKIEHRPSSVIQKSQNKNEKLIPNSEHKERMSQREFEEIRKTEFGSPGLFSTLEQRTLESNRGPIQQKELFHSPIITGTIRSVSPFTNDNLGIPTMNQEMIESRPTSGKKRVTNTLLQYEAALLNLEKENKAINEALKKKKEESQSKEEEMLKLRAKNQDLLRKLRIRDSQTKQILSKNPGTIRGLPNYLYSNPAKVLQYLKRNSISCLRTSHTDLKEPSSFIINQVDSDNKFVSVGPAAPVSELMSLGSRPTNFQTYLTMKRYTNPHGTIANSEKIKEGEVQGSLNESPRLFSSFERGCRYEMPLQMSTPQLPRQKSRDLSPCFVLKGTSYVRPNGQITRNKLFSESTKLQLKRTREAAQQIGNKMKGKKSFEEHTHSTILS